MADPPALILAPRIDSDETAAWNIVAELAEWLWWWHRDNGHVSRRTEDLAAVEGLAEHQVIGLLDNIDQNWPVLLERVRLDPDRTQEILECHQPVLDR